MEPATAHCSSLLPGRQFHLLKTLEYSDFKEQRQISLSFVLIGVIFICLSLVLLSEPRAKLVPEK
ncbi:MAG: hypothetical protein JW804_08970 [Sedimentisphaerales bacterium]|nr:hypothetical protein [Sedimentisphaerales bacterium]